MVLGLNFQHVDEWNHLGMSIYSYILTSQISIDEFRKDDKFSKCMKLGTAYLEPEPVKLHGYTSRRCRAVVTEWRLRGKQLRIKTTMG